MKGRRQKSQCEAGALDISALGAGPEVRNRIGTVLRGSASSLVYVGGGAGVGVLIRSGSNSSFDEQIILSVCL